MLKISVSGNPGEGKTTLLALVHGFLTKAGLKVKCEGKSLTSDEFGRLAASITGHDFDASKLEITLEEIQQARDSVSVEEYRQARRLRLFADGWYPMSSAPTDGSFFMAVSHSGKVEPVQYIPDPMDPQPDRQFGRGNMRLKCLAWKPFPASGLEDI